MSVGLSGVAQNATVVVDQKSGTRGRSVCSEERMRSFGGLLWPQHPRRPRSATTSTQNNTVKFSEDCPMLVSGCAMSLQDSMFKGVGNQRSLQIARRGRAAAETTLVPRKEVISRTRANAGPT